jgi:hypothetical protein
MGKALKIFVLLCIVIKKRPKEINRPIGKILPNLVTLKECIPSSKFALIHWKKSFLIILIFRSIAKGWIDAF